MIALWRKGTITSGRIDVLVLVFNWRSDVGRQDVG